MGKLQNEDHKSEAELVAAGGTKAQLLNDTKIYVTANSINKTLDDAIIDGDIGGGGSTAMNDLTDVDTTGVSIGQFLLYNGTTWVDHTILINDINDVRINTPLEDQVLRYDSVNGWWVNETLNIDGLGDVNSPSPTDGQVLTWNSTASEWQPATASSGANALNDLSDAAVSTPTVGQVLRYNNTSGDFENSKLNFASESFNDVNTTGATDGQVLAWDSTAGEWQPATPGTPIAAVEPALYERTVGQSFPSGAFTIVDYNVLDTDADSLVTTGATWKYTVPSSGVYEVTACLTTNFTGFDIGEQTQLSIYVNGSRVKRIAGVEFQTSDNSGNAHFIIHNGSALLNLAASDEVDVRFFHNSGATSTSLGGADGTYVSILKK